LHIKARTTTAKVWETSTNSYVCCCGELLRVLGTYNKRLEGTLSSSIHGWATHSFAEGKHYPSHTLEKVSAMIALTSWFGKAIQFIYLNLCDFYIW